VRLDIASLSLKHAIDSNPIIGKLPPVFRKKVIKISYLHFERTSYIVHYRSFGRFIVIAYNGNKFGLDDLKQVSKLGNRHFGGGGTRRLLNNPHVSYVYTQSGCNLWTITGDFPVIKYDQKVPEDGLAHKGVPEVLRCIKDDDFIEIVSNIFYHHNVKSEKNVFWFVLKSNVKHCLQLLSDKINEIIFETISFLSSDLDKGLDVRL